MFLTCRLTWQSFGSDRVVGWTAVMPAGSQGGWGCLETPRQCLQPSGNGWTPGSDCRLPGRPGGMWKPTGACHCHWFVRSSAPTWPPHHLPSQGPHLLPCLRRGGSQLHSATVSCEGSSPAPSFLSATQGPPQAQNLPQAATGGRPRKGNGWGSEG